METYEEGVRRATQTKAEIDALELLWSGTMRNFTPERKRFTVWRQLVGYVETTHCINQTGSEFIRCRNLMYPNQLIRFMDRAVNCRQRKADESLKEGQR